MAGNSNCEQLEAHLKRGKACKRFKGAPLWRLEREGSKGGSGAEMIPARKREQAGLPSKICEWPLQLSVTLFANLEKLLQDLRGQLTAPRDAKGRAASKVARGRWSSGGR